MSSRSSNKSFQPPKFPGLHCVGWIQTAHGIRGEVFVRLYAQKADWLSSLQSFQLLTKNSPSPIGFDVQAARPHKEGLIVTLAGVKDRNRAEELVRSGVYIEDSMLESEAGEPIFLAQILGFQLIDLQGVVLGEIAGFGSNGPQDLLKVQKPSGGEGLVPFVEAFIRNIDFDKRTVAMELPEGLLDLED